MSDFNAAQETKTFDISSVNCHSKEFVQVRAFTCWRHDKKAMAEQGAKAVIEIRVTEDGKVIVETDDCVEFRHWKKT